MALNLLAPAVEQINWLTSGKITSSKLLDAYIERYSRLNPALNAVVSLDIERAKHLASEIDGRRARGEDIGALAGLPMTVKDCLDVNGLPAICGAPQFANRPSNVDDALVVNRLKEAGAIIWGKTNVPIYCGDVQTYNKVYGTTNNPYDLTRTPGGSSGGAAAALATGLTPLEVGSDIGGSIRTPASFCGVYGLKPTYGLVPSKGHVPPSPHLKDTEAPDLGVVGPMARNIEDLELLMSIIAPDSEKEALPTSCSELKIGIWQEPSFTISDEVADAVNLVANAAKTAGAFVSIDKPDFEGKNLVNIYQRLLIPFITSELPSVAKGIFKLAKPVAKLFAKKGELSFSNTIISATQKTNEIAEAEQERDLIKKKCDAFFEQYDVLISPVTSVPAIPHNNKKSLYRRKIEVNGALVNYTSLFEWITLSSACHLPSISIPVKRSSDDLPIGIQIIGKIGADRKILSIARLLAGELNFSPTPDML